MKAEKPMTREERKKICDDCNIQIRKDIDKIWVQPAVKNALVESEARRIELVDALEAIQKSEDSEIVRLKNQLAESEAKIKELKYELEGHKQENEALKNSIKSSLPEIRKQAEHDLRHDAMQECCICGKYASCTEVSMGSDRHFRCCSRKCLSMLFEYEDNLKNQAIKSIFKDDEQINNWIEQKVKEERERIRKAVENIIKDIEKKADDFGYICMCMKSDCDYSEYQGMYNDLKEKVLELLEEKP
jgi:small-conductance mechanosensitive channel